MAKMGRPKTDNPRNVQIGFNATAGEAARLKKYAAIHNMTITDVLRRGIEMQYENEKTVRS